MYGFYIDGSIHQIGFITDLLEKLHGKLFTDSESSFTIIQRDFPSISVLFLHDMNAIIQAMRNEGIRVLILQDFHYKKFMKLKQDGVKFVQIFHGTSDKTYNLNRESRYYDLVCLTGRSMLEDFNRKGLNKHGNCVVTGNLKADRIFKKQYNRDDEIHKLGFDPNKKTVLYAPTWMDGMGNSSFRKFGIALPDYFPDEFQLIIKLHPNLHLYRTELVNRLILNIVHKKNILLLEQSAMIYDIVPVMAAADLLITDVSGVSYEYIAFLRPIIFLNNRSPLRFLYGSRRKKIWVAGDVVSSLDALPETIRQNIENPQRYKNIQERIVKDTYAFTDGKTADRITGLVQKLIR
jgi:CDP-glycerol glycerophosphotransferase (TagB/SpsB family)